MRARSRLRKALACKPLAFWGHKIKTFHTSLAHPPPAFYYKHTTQRERDKITTISDTLFGRLSAQGLMPVEIPRLIKDVFNIIGDRGNFTAASVNQRLDRLEWGERIMDELSFELIIFRLEKEYHYEVKKYTLPAPLRRFPYPPNRTHVK